MQEQKQEWTSALGEGTSEHTQMPEKPHEEEKGQDISERLRRYLDIPLTIEVVVGSAVLTLGELLQLAPGSVVELREKVEYPVDIRVNGRLIAKGEIVVVEDRFGVRIIDIITEEERLRKVI